MPGEILALWRRTLDALAADPQSLDRTLDWPLKRALYVNWGKDRIDWESVPHWNFVMKRIGTALPREECLDGAGRSTSS